MKKEGRREGEGGREEEKKQEREGGRDEGREKGREGHRRSIMPMTPSFAIAIK